MIALRARGRALALAGGLFLASAGLLPALSAPRAEAGEEQRERHPEIHRALHEMREAKKYLEKADHDFGGHRVKAIKDLDRAIHQLELALKYDKR
jgi:hypothetical protein